LSLVKVTRPASARPSVRGSEPAFKGKGRKRPFSTSHAIPNAEPPDYSAEKARRTYRGQLVLDCGACITGWRGRVSGIAFLLMSFFNIERLSVDFDFCPFFELNLTVFYFWKSISAEIGERCRSTCCSSQVKLLRHSAPQRQSFKNSQDQGSLDEIEIGNRQSWLAKHHRRRRFLA
jgi:hypothetical protein